MAFADDYVSVNERLDQFFKRFPEGRIQTEIAEHTVDLVIMRATIYRDAEDVRPTIAHSQLCIPGSTNFTRGSEVENAETSAVGRALAFMGFLSKKGIASREEVQSRSGGNHGARRESPASPVWGADLVRLLHESGLSMRDLEPVVEDHLTSENYIMPIEAWLRGGEGGEGRTVDMLVSRAADMKAAAV